LTRLLLVLACLVVAFLIGSIPFGLILGRVFFRSDIRESGSGNIGAANAARTYGRGAGIAVFVLDALKGILAVVVTKALASAAHLDPLVIENGIAPEAAFMAVLGHCYSPWLGFKGGKGVATFFGVLCALSGYSIAIFAVVWIAVILRTGYASLSSMLATTGAALFICAYACAYDRNIAQGYCAFAVLSTILIVWRHGDNIRRLRAGTEPKLKLARPEGPSGSGGKRVGSI
jgi:glycerol-3-phosphate acyltransferase PlsY